MYGHHWSAIQVITASSAAAVADLIMRGEIPHKGYVLQEEIDFDKFCSTEFMAPLLKTEKSKRKAA